MSALKHPCFRALSSMSSVLGLWSVFYKPFASTLPAFFQHVVGIFCWRCFVFYVVIFCRYFLSVFVCRCILSLHTVDFLYVVTFCRYLSWLHFVCVLPLGNDGKSFGRACRRTCDKDSQATSPTQERGSTFRAPISGESRLSFATSFPSKTLCICDAQKERQSKGSR